MENEKYFCVTIFDGRAPLTVKKDNSSYYQTVTNGSPLNLLKDKQGCVIVNSFEITYEEFMNHSLQIAYLK
jgi:hypothetical protein